MEAYHTRFESFFKVKRVKNGKKTVNAKWPHPDSFVATPSALAEAGFYYSPTWDDKDNVACYLCEKEFAGWEDEDDPLSVHYEKCGEDCAWAIVRCGLPADFGIRGGLSYKDPSRLPTGKQMEKARLATFKTNGWWPYDRIKGHRVSSAKMAKAGFVYTPQAAGDDTATCLYCHITLGGWEEEDDPHEEHRKRAVKSNLPCPFFVEPTLPPPTAKTTRASTAKPRTRAGSRQPQQRDSSVSSDEIEVVAPAKGRRAPSSASTLDSNRRSTRKPVTHTSDDELPEAPAPPAPPKRNRVNSNASTTEPSRRSTRHARPTTGADGPEDDASGSELSRSTRGRAAKGRVRDRFESIAEEGEEEQPPPPPPKTKASKGKENSTEPTTKPKRGRPRKKPEHDRSESEESVEARRATRKGKKAPVAEEPQDEDEGEKSPPAAVKKTAKKVSKAKAKPLPPLPKKAHDEHSEDSEDEDQESKSQLRTSKSRKQKQVANRARSSQESDEEHSSDTHSLPRTTSHPSKGTAIGKQPSTVVSKRKQPSPIVEDNSSEDELASAPIRPPGGSKRKPKEVAQRDNSDDESNAEQPDLPPAPRSKQNPPKPLARANDAKASASSDVEMHTAEEDLASAPDSEPERPVNTKQNRSASPPSKRTGKKPPSGKRAEVDSDLNASTVSRASASSRSSRTRVASVSSNTSKVSKDVKAKAPASRAEDRMDVDDMGTQEKKVGTGSDDIGTERPIRPPRSPPRVRSSHSSERETTAPSTPPRPKAPSPPAPARPNGFLNKAPIAREEIDGPLLPESGTELSAEERAMTVEEWIRREIGIQYERFRIMGEARIQAFKAQAEETRRQIEAM